MSIHPLLGTVVTAAWLASDKKAIKFDIQGGDSVIARCDGDCCSSTWIEAIEGIDAVVGNKVTGVGDRTYRQSDSSELKVYGCVIETPMGRCSIEYRNASNGYYGGGLVWGDDYFYGGVYNQNVSNDDWKPATDFTGGV